MNTLSYLLVASTFLFHLVGSANASPPSIPQGGAYDVSAWGAKCDGQTDDAPALQSAIDFVYAHAPATLSFSNGICAISTSLLLPPGGNVNFMNGYIKAGPEYHSDFLITTTGKKSISSHDLMFSNMTLDVDQKGGALKLDNYLRVVYHGGRIIHYSTVGVELGASADSHEAIFSDMFVAQYLYGEPMPAFTGTGFVINAHDNSFHDIVGSFSKDLFVVNASYNFIHSIHAYVQGHCIWATDKGVWLSLNNNYFDGCDVLLEDPWQTELMGNKFLFNTTEPRNAITLKPMGPNRSLVGMKIFGNSFHNSKPKKLNAIAIDNRRGTFKKGGGRDNTVKYNSFSNFDLGEAIAEEP